MDSLPLRDQGISLTFVNGAGLFFLMAVFFKAECDRALNERQHSSECRSLELSENVSELQHDQETRKLKS